MCKIKRKLLCVVVLAAIISFFLPQSAFALEKEIFITVKINDSFVKTEVTPYLKNDNVYVPLRFVYEALNADVCWMPEENTALICYGTKYIQLMTAKTDEAVINGKRYQLDMPLEVVDDRIMVPVAFIAETLEGTLKWDESTYSVVIEKEGITVPDEYKKDYSEEDLFWLARIVDVEAGNLSIDGKLAIANVILNRKRSPGYPDTIYDVIFEINGGHMQFPPAFRDGFKERVPSRDSVIAAKMALEGVNNIGDCLFFNNVPFRGKENDLYKVIEGEYFYR